MSSIGGKPPKKDAHKTGPWLSSSALGPSDPRLNPERAAAIPLAEKSLSLDVKSKLRRWIGAGTKKRVAGGDAEKAGGGGDEEEEESAAMIASDGASSAAHRTSSGENKLASANSRTTAVGLMRAAMAGSRWRKQTYAKFAPYLAPFVSTYLQEEVMSGLIRGGKQRTTMMGETAGGTKWDMLPGAVLVADISGFTPLTERLTKKGPGGIELLTKCINSYFDLIIGTVEAHGGDVIKFAGDAVICLFKRAGPEYGCPEERLDNAVQAAVWAAASLAGHLGRMQMQPDRRVTEAPREANQTGTHRAARLLECLERGIKGE